MAKRKGRNRISSRYWELMAPKLALKRAADDLEFVDALMNCGVPYTKQIDRIAMRARMALERHRPNGDRSNSGDSSNSS